MLCKLCREREADKKNTHCLTDGIIRSALNIDGSSSNRDREKGLFFDLSTDSPFVEFGFQRQTPAEKLWKELGREPTDKEIEKAKRNPYAVDDCFCSVCEAHFGVIESEFIASTLPKLRKANLSGITDKLLPQAVLATLFFYLQLWRSAVCLDEFSLSSEMTEKLWLIILNYESMNDEEIRQFPISVTYLETTGEDFEYTKNLVGFTTGENPYILFMNDFVVQFYENYDCIKPVDFHGLNDGNYRMFINPIGEEFIINIFLNNQRGKFLRAIYEANVERAIHQLRERFAWTWFQLTSSTASVELTDEYMAALIMDSRELATQYTAEIIAQKTYDFIVQRVCFLQN